MSTCRRIGWRLRRIGRKCTLIHARAEPARTSISLTMCSLASIVRVRTRTVMIKRVESSVYRSGSDTRSSSALGKRSRSTLYRRSLTREGADVTDQRYIDGCFVASEKSEPW